MGEAVQGGRHCNERIQSMLRNPSQSLDGGIAKPDARQSILASERAVEARGGH